MQTTRFDDQLGEEMVPAPAGGPVLKSPFSRNDDVISKTLAEMARTAKIASLTGGPAAEALAESWHTQAQTLLPQHSHVVMAHVASLLPKAGDDVFSRKVLLLAENIANVRNQDPDILPEGLRKGAEKHKMAMQTRANLQEAKT